MRRSWFAAIAIVAVSAGAAHAELFDAPDWYGRAKAFVRSLTGERVADHEVIEPPGNIDPKMAVVPPQMRAPMPIIKPPGDAGR